MERARYCYDSAVRGYQIYQDIWEANYGELLSCTRETGNVFDPFASDHALTCTLKKNLEDGSWGRFARYTYLLWINIRG